MARLDDIDGITGISLRPVSESEEAQTKEAQGLRKIRDGRVMQPTVSYQMYVRKLSRIQRNITTTCHIDISDTNGTLCILMFR